MSDDNHTILFIICKCTEGRHNSKIQHQFQFNVTQALLLKIIHILAGTDNVLMINSMFYGSVQ